MKPIHADIRGFRRLVDVSFDISPRVLAFVGKNEAGKSSVLDSLVWLTNAGTKPLPYKDRARSSDVPVGATVSVRYWLDEADQEAISDLGLEPNPQLFVLSKDADGVTSGDFPSQVSRGRQEFDSALAALKAAIAVPGVEWGEPDDEESFNAIAQVVFSWLETQDREWSPADVKRATSLCTWLEEDVDDSTDPSGHSEGAVRNPTLVAHASAARELRAILSTVVRPHPRETAIGILRGRVPKFIKYDEKFRDLPTSTPFDPKNGLPTVAPSLQNLLEIAGLQRSEIQNLKTNSDWPALRDLLSEGNGRLRAFFSQSWNQSHVTVEFHALESALECNVKDLRTDKSTSIEERSDGLRAFVSLAAFVESQRLNFPPILLIDEAETHLHIDAQADLVAVLMASLNVTKIIYTTHSPGCLPADLGTGIRLVERSPGNDPVSTVTGHFWQNRGPGFSPLLYAMGASAAAFSACRRAVLTEGPSEMILLPTLLRDANGLDDFADLGYQVVQGLAQSKSGRDDLEEVAAKVVYLPDGDATGKRYREERLAAGVSEARVVSYPDGWALEDLLNPDYLLATVSALSPGQPKFPAPDDLPGEGPILPRLKTWAKSQKPAMSIAGKTALAYAVVDDADRRLAPGAKQALRKLQKDIEKGFSE